MLPGSHSVLSTFLPRAAARRLHAGDPAAGGRARLFGVEHRAPGRAEPHRGVQRVAGGARQPLAGRSHRLASSASRSRWRCSTIRSSRTTMRACTAASSSSPPRSRSCRSTTRSRGAQRDRGAGAAPVRAADRRSQAAARRAAIGSRIDALIESARDVLAINNRVVDREVERLRANAEAGAAQPHPAADLQHRGRAHHRARADALHRAPDRRDRRRHPPARRRRLLASRSRCAGPEDLRYLGGRLDWLRRRLDEFETQKNRFLRHVSHELKTPLTALREGAELLHDEIGGPLRRRSARWSAS